MTTGQAKLVVMDGKIAGKSFPIDKPVILGRHPGLAAQIPDVKISREHSKVFRQGGDFYIVDLNSRNGTLVNDAPVTRRLLRDRDEITIGETRLRFELEAPAEPEVEVSTPRGPAVKEVIDLKPRAPAQAPPASPAGALSADEIVVKDDALQFSRFSGEGKKKSVLFDDLGQRSFSHQVIVGAVILLLAVGIFMIGLMLAGVVG